MSTDDKVKHFQVDLRKDAVIIEYLQIKVIEAQSELDKIKRRAKKTQVVIDELKDVKDELKEKQNGKK